MKSSKTFFSVIIPVYKTEKYLAECLQSLLNQEYINFEAVVVDDGSPLSEYGSVQEIFNKTVQKDLRFKFYQQKNQGVSAARNFALKNSVGEFVLFLDSDDTYSSDHLEIIKNSIEKAGNWDSAIFYTLGCSLNNGENIEVIENRPTNLSQELISPSIAVMNLVLPRKLTEGHEFPNFRPHEEPGFYLKIAFDYLQKNKKNIHFYSIRSFGYKYLKHSNSYTQETLNQNQWMFINGYAVLFKYILDNCKVPLFYKIIIYFSSLRYTMYGKKGFHFLVVRKLASFCAKVVAFLIR